MDQAREHARQKALAAIRTAGDKDWRAHAEWLKVAFPADYRGSGTKVDVSTSVQVGVLVYTEKRQQQILARTKELLGKQPLVGP